MAFPPEFLEELRNRLPLQEVIGRRVKLTKRGREYVGLSPFNAEKTPSFTVVPEKGFYHCFSSGEHGDVISWVMKTEGLGFADAVERLAGQAGLAMPRSSPAERQAAERRRGLQEALEAACGWFEEQLRSAAGQAALAYLESRGLTQETIAAFRLGYAPDVRGLLRRTLNAQGFADPALISAGLIKQPEEGGEPRDYFFNRVIFPIADRQGRILAFGGRAMAKDARAKYLNSPDSEVFHKGQVLYNLHRARRAAHDTGELIVAEGYMDVIALDQAGFPAAVAPLGTALTELQIQEAWRLAPEPTVCLDGDAAGQRAAFRALDRALPLLRAGKSLKFATLPKGEDPDSLVRGQGPAAFRDCLEHARPLVEVLWDRETGGQRFETPEQRAGLRRRLLDAAAAIREPDLREEYRLVLQERFDGVFRKARGRRTARDGGPRRIAARYAKPSPRQWALQEQKVLWVTLINHPELIADLVEEIASLDIGDRFLEELRDKVLSWCSEELNAGRPLDAERLQAHLSQAGFDELVKSLLRDEVYKYAPNARRETDPQAARRDVLVQLKGLATRRKVGAA